MLRDLFVIEFNRVMDGTHNKFNFNACLEPTTMYKIGDGQFIYEYQEDNPFRLSAKRIFETPTDAINFLKGMCDSRPIESQFCIIRAIRHCIAELETIQYRTDTNFSRIDYSIDIERPGAGKITLREMHTDYRKIKKVIYDEDNVESASAEDDNTSRWVHKNNYRDMDGTVCETCYCDNCKNLYSERTPYCPNCGRKMI